MYVVNTGVCRVTQHQHISDSAERVRQWVTEVFNAFSMQKEPVKLYEPNEKGILEALLKAIKKLKSRKVKQFDRLEEERNKAAEISGDDSLLVSSDRMQVHDRMRKDKATRITYRDLIDDDSIERVLQDNNAKLETLLYSARQQGLVIFEGMLTLVTDDEQEDPGANMFFSTDLSHGSSKDGPVIALSKTVTAVEGKSSSYMMCEALRNGAIVCDLLNMFVPPRKRIAVWKPSMLDQAVAGSVALTADLVDGTFDMAGDVAIITEELAREAAERAEIAAREAKKKSAEMAEAAASKAAEEAAKRGGAAGAAAVEQMKAGKEALREASDRAEAAAREAKKRSTEMAEAAAKKAGEEVAKRGGEGYQQAMEQMEQAKEQIKSAAADAQALAIDGAQGEGGALAVTVNASDAAGAATDGIYDALGGGPRQNVKAFRQLFLDRENGLDLPSEDALAEEDLLDFNKGTDQEQDEKQARVLKCLISLAMSVQNREGYMGPQLDEINLGTLASGEFFGEIALLPLKGGWRHRRTITALTNSLLYALNRQKVELLGQRFPSLKNTLTDHAEDFEKVTAVRTVQSGIAEAVRDSKAKNQGGERDGGGNDPISMIQEHLQQQDGKMSELDLKLSEQDRQMKVVQRQLGELIAMLRK
jgi:CRP-like cAMP-binding protein